jgi:hypothetical protein
MPPWCRWRDSRDSILTRQRTMLADAEKAYTEALVIYRDLAQRDPGTAKRS